MVSSRLLVLSLGVSLLSLAACDSADPDPDPVLPADAVPGIEVRTAGNDFLGVIGSPVRTGPSDGVVRTTPVYPNPGIYVVTIGYVVEQPTEVSVTIERLPPTPALHAAVRAVLPDFPQGEPATVRTFEAVQRPTGLFEVRWHGLDDDDNPAGAGYYRLTIHADAEVHTQDLMLVETEADGEALRAAAQR